MPNVWTQGIWTVKPGREDEFVRAWQEMARDMLVQFEPAGPPHLLRDRERPAVFHSLGPWDSIETIDRFRAALGPHLERIRELLVSFETLTLDEVPLDG